MQRKSLMAVFLTLIVLMNTGCSKLKEIPEVNLDEMIMVDNEVRKNTGFTMTVQVDDDEIIGEIISVVKSTEIPKENDQANFEIKGSKYATYGKDIIVLIDNEWVLFLKEEDWVKYDKPIDNRLSIDYSALDKDIFGNLTDEEIKSLFSDISNKILEDKDYENNLDSIILNSFKDYGMDVSSKLDAVKNGIIINN